MTFAQGFITQTISILSQIDSTEIEKAVDLLAGIRANSGRLFTCGSGGGAGHASHATCDFRKLCAIEAYCVTDNVSELTARVNDEGWDTSYSNWLAVSNLGKRDALLVFSVGGGSVEPPVSTNLIEACKAAKSVGAKVIAIVGRDGGAIATLADAAIVIPPLDPSSITPQTEGLQAVVWHLLVSHPSLARQKAKWEGLDLQIV